MIKYISGLPNGINIDMASVDVKKNKILLTFETEEKKVSQLMGVGISELIFKKEDGNKIYLSNILWNYPPIELPSKKFIIEGRW